MSAQDELVDVDLIGTEPGHVKKSIMVMYALHYTALGFPRRPSLAVYRKDISNMKRTATYRITPYVSLPKSNHLFTKPQSQVRACRTRRRGNKEIYFQVIEKIDIVDPAMQVRVTSTLCLCCDTLGHDQNGPTHTTVRHAMP